MGFDQIFTISAKFPILEYLEYLEYLELGQFRNFCDVLRNKQTNATSVSINAPIIETKN